MTNLLRGGLIAALLVGAAGPAWAGSLAWTVTTAAGATTFSADVADADIARIMSAYRAILAVPQEASDADVQGMIVTGVLEGMLANVMNHEQTAAAKAAREAVPTITATPQPRTRR